MYDSFVVDFYLGGLMFWVGFSDVVSSIEFSIVDEGVDDDFVFCNFVDKG